MNSRVIRWILVVGLICICAVLTRSVGAQSSTAWPPDAPQHQLYMIGNSHIDIPWLWPWPESMSLGLSTFRSALDRIDEFPQFKFTASSAQLYEWAAAADPKLIAEVRKRVAEGRWDVVGGWWVEPDINMPNGESLIRQGLYGQNVLQQLVGRRALVGYNPDSFGHPASLPQILKLQGLHAYVFMRPNPQQKPLPADVFWWQGVDGTRILTYRINFAYQITGDLEKRMHDYVALQEPTNKLMIFYGVGDHGGGPTKEAVQFILDAQKQPGAPKISFGTPDGYFQDIGKRKDYPVVADDLEGISVGAYTSVSEVKKDNRSTEAALAAGEKMAALSSVLTGFPYPKAEFTASWKRVLLMQFHDALAGTAHPQQYVDSHAAYGFATDVANQALYRATEKIAWQIPTADPASEYLVVFNPHAWAAKLNVQYDLKNSFADRGGAPVDSRLEDEDGNPLAHQWTAAQTANGERKGLVFQAPVPAFGYRQFRVRKIEPIQATGEFAVRATDRGLENEHLRVTFADDGTLKLFDKDAGAEVFQGAAGGARAVVIEDTIGPWGGTAPYKKEIGAFSGASFRVLENGPVRATLRVRTSYGASFLRTDWMLYAGARTLEARVLLDWHERQKFLKFSFPVDVQNPKPVYEIAYGYKVREPDGEERPGQRWIDLSGDRNGSPYGLTVLNDAKYGYNVQGSDLRVSIVHSPAFSQGGRITLDPNGEYLWQDQGMQSFRMLLGPHASTWQDAGVVRMAEELTAPAPVLYQGIHPGSRPQSASFLAVDVPNVVVSVVKKAEDGDDLIVRCYETAGRPTKASLDLKLVHRRWTGDFHPLEIKTLRVPLAPAGTIREVNALEQSYDVTRGAEQTTVEELKELLDTRGATK